MLSYEGPYQPRGKLNSRISIFIFILTSFVVSFSIVGRVNTFTCIHRVAGDGIMSSMGGRQMGCLPMLFIIFLWIIPVERRGLCYFPRDNNKWRFLQHLEMNEKRSVVVDLCFSREIFSFFSRILISRQMLAGGEGGGR